MQLGRHAERLVKPKEITEKKSERWNGKLEKIAKKGEGKKDKQGPTALFVFLNWLHVGFTSVLVTDCTV